ncbi:7-aminocholesterol resistance protein RTA1 [Histoplasma ohiense]|nr:7-aminocholesterol resistance protein RTA1 [Histoplasma ohiense (nom. inval.)]
MAEEEFHDFYKYVPSKPAAIIFIVLFLSTTSLHTFQLVKKRVWFFIPVVLGGIFEIVGYIARIVSSTQAPLFKDTPYIIQSIFLLLAPALFAASIYMELGRIIAILQGEKLSIIRRTWMTKIFVSGDILSFVVQGAGGGIMSSGAKSNLSLGQKVIIVGLCIQLTCFGLFVIVSAIFHRRMAARPTTASLSIQVPWHKYMYSLYAVSSLIIIRSIFRVVEYIQGADGILLRHEFYLYVFDAALMWILMVVLNAVHPGVISELLKGDTRLKSVRVGMHPEELGLTDIPHVDSRPIRKQRPSFAKTTYARHTIATRGLA